jgi:hypothetical protein
MLRVVFVFRTSRKRRTAGRTTLREGRERKGNNPHLAAKDSSAVALRTRERRIGLIASNQEYNFKARSQHAKQLWLRA